MRVGIQSLPLVMVLLLPYSVAFLGGWCFVGSLYCTIALVTIFGVMFALRGHANDQGKRVVQQRKDKKEPPCFRLNTITSSHFVEKVRWALDRLGVPYTEEQDCGILGVFLSGRSVPVLIDDATHVSIGNSSDILAYLYGKFRDDERFAERAGFLQRTPQTVQLENTIDELGFLIQGYGYHYLIHDKDLVLTFWGADEPSLPIYQRLALKALFPILKLIITKVFKLDDRALALKRETRIKEIFAEMGGLIEKNGGKYILGDEISYVDLAFCALGGILMVPNNAGGTAIPAGMNPQKYESRLPQALKDIKQCLLATTAGKYIMDTYESDRL
mmetsp:Transcript_18220/g.51432  ORF Transcript_18220/g.51432 Transcript_18220/m.51432 type:complete len:330 (+) Transcript_18220:80-1069(+)